jgi:hypothetical protein
MYWRARALGFRRLWGPAGMKGIGHGINGGLLAACRAVAYLASGIIFALVYPSVSALLGSAPHRSVSRC